MKIQMRKNDCYKKSLFCIFFIYKLQMLWQNVLYNRVKSSNESKRIKKHKIKRPPEEVFSIPHHADRLAISNNSYLNSLCKSFTVYHLKVTVSRYKDFKKGTTNARTIIWHQFCFLLFFKLLKVLLDTELGVS